MHRRPFTALAVLIAFILSTSFASVPRASAEVENYREPVSFVLDPGQCPELTTTITAEGEYHFRIVTNVDKNGDTHILFNLTATGTAVDTEGNTYVFNYHNHANEKIAAGGFPHTIVVTDHLNLVGGGTAGTVHVGFTLKITVPESGPDIVTEVSVRGDPNCDVI